MRDSLRERILTKAREATEEGYDSRLSQRPAYREIQQYLKYQGSPEGFGSEILGHTYYDDLIEVMHSFRDNQVTIARSATGPGKTFTAADLAVWAYKCFPGSQVFLCAAPPIDNLQKLLWGKVKDITQLQPGLFRLDKIQELNIERSAQEFITGVTIPSTGSASEREARFSGKHAPHLFFICDEGDAIPPEVYKGIDGCMSGGNAHLLILFNPKFEAGPVYLKEKNRQANVIELSALNHPNVKIGDNIVPGAVTRNAIVQRIHEWTREIGSSEQVKPGDPNLFVVPDYLQGYIGTSQSGRKYRPLRAGERRIIVQPEFFYKVLGRYPTAGLNQLISKASIYAAVERWKEYVAKWGEVPPVGIIPSLGQDMAEQGGDNCASCFRYEDWVPHLTTWNDREIPDSVDEIIKICKALDLPPDCVMVDANGLGSSVPSLLKKQGQHAYRVMAQMVPTKQTNKDIGLYNRYRDQLWFECRNWILSDKSMLPPDNDLLEELWTPTYEVRNGKIIVTDKPTLRLLLGRSPDKADSLCMTFAEEIIDAKAEDIAQGMTSIQKTQVVYTAPPVNNWY